MTDCSGANWTECTLISLEAASSSDSAAYQRLGVDGRVRPDHDGIVCAVVCRDF